MTEHGWYHLEERLDMAYTSNSVQTNISFGQLFPQLLATAAGETVDDDKGENEQPPPPKKRMIEVEGTRCPECGETRCDENCPGIE